VSTAIECIRVCPHKHAWHTHVCDTFLRVCKSVTRMAHIRVRHTLIHSYTLLYTLIHSYSFIFTLIHSYSPLFTLIHSYTPLFTLIHSYSLLFTLIHSDTLLYTLIRLRVCKSVTRMAHIRVWHTLLYTLIHSYAPLFTLLHSSTLLCVQYVLVCHGDALSHMCCVCPFFSLKHSPANMRVRKPHTYESLCGTYESLI